MIGKTFSDPRVGLLLLAGCVVAASACNKEPIDLSAFNVECEGDDDCQPEQRCGVADVCVAKEAPGEGSGGGGPGDDAGDETGEEAGDETGGEAGDETGGETGGETGVETGDDPTSEAGELGQPCRSGDTCDEGLECDESQVCQKSGDDPPDCDAFCNKLRAVCGADLEEGCEAFCGDVVGALGGLKSGCLERLAVGAGHCDLIPALEMCSETDDRLCREDADCDERHTCHGPFCGPSGDSGCGGLWGCVEGCHAAARQARLDCEPPNASFRECAHDCFEVHDRQVRRGDATGVDVGAMACAHDCAFVGGPPPPPDNCVPNGTWNEGEPPYCQSRNARQDCDNIQSLCGADDEYDVSCRDVVSCMLMTCGGQITEDCLRRCDVDPFPQDAGRWADLKLCFKSSCIGDPIIDCLKHSCRADVEECGFPVDRLGGGAGGGGGGGNCQADAGCGRGQVCAGDEGGPSACRGPRTGEEWLRCEQRCAQGDNPGEYPTCVGQCLDSVQEHGHVDDHRAVVVATACRQDCELPLPGLGEEGNITLPTCDLTRYGDGHCGPADGNLSPENLEQVDLVCRDVVGCMLLACGPVNPNCEARCGLRPSSEDQVNPWEFFMDCLEDNCSAANNDGGPVGLPNCVQNHCAEAAELCGYPVDLLGVLGWN